MKTMFKILIIIFISFSCSKNDNNTYSIDDTIQKNCDKLKVQGIIDSFPYPVRPGSSAWTDLGSLEARYEAVSVPNSILNNMCTHGLVYTCVYCPFFQGHFTAYNFVRTGFLSLCKNINSFAELIERDDAAEELYAYYNTLFDTTWESIELTENRMQILTTEIFFAQQEFLTKFSVVEIEEALLGSYDILTEKEINNYSGINGSYYLMSEILYNNLEYGPLIDFMDKNRANYFLNDLWVFNYQPADTLKYYIDSYIDNYIKK